MPYGRSQTALGNNIWNSVAAAALLMAIGCGGPDYGQPVSVSGKVTLDGQPLAELTVIYHNTGGLPAEFRTQRARTDAKGIYSLAEVYPGEYTILFEQVAAAPEDPGMAPAHASATDSSLAKYSGDNAPSATVSESTDEINFELESQ